MCAVKFWGVDKAYTLDSWSWPLKCRMEGLGLQALCELRRWALVGSRVAHTMGRGGGCTHTHTTHARPPARLPASPPTHTHISLGMIVKSIPECGGRPT